MAEVKKEVKAQKPKIDDKAAKDAAKATLLGLAKTDTQKAAAVKAPSAVQNVQKPEEKAVKSIPEIETGKAEPVKATASAAKPEAPKAVKAEPEVKTEAESKKEADPGKEFVDGIMTEMNLKGGSKKRLVKMLGEQFNFDKQRVIFKLKRALISERYAALHAEAGH